MKPVLPQGLREEWRNVELPQWVTDSLMLEPGAKFQQLDGANNPSVDESAAERVVTGLLKHLARNLPAIQDVRFFTETIPPTLTTQDLFLGQRTFNALKRGGLVNAMELQRVTIGDLLKISGFGVKCLVELAGGYERYKADLPERQLRMIVDLSSSVDNSAANKIVDNSDAQQTMLLRALKEATSILNTAVTEDWPSFVSEKDPRFSSYLPVGNGTFEDRYLDFSEFPLENAHKIIEMRDAVEPIKQRVLDVRQTPLLHAFREILSAMSGVSDSMLDGLIARFGLGGDPPATLQSAGDIAQRTRERMRQIESRVNARKPKHPIFMPLLIDLIDAIGAELPTSAENAGKISIRLGFADREIHPKSVLAMAEFCGIPVSGWQSSRVGSDERITRQLSFDPREVLQIAKALADASGVSNVYLVSGELSESQRIDASEIVEIITGFSDLEFLDGPWFWNPDGTQNRLNNVTRRMLSVTSEMTLGDIKAGAARAYAFRNSSGNLRYEITVPPISILRHFYIAHTGFEVTQNDRVRPTGALNYRQELGATEQAFVDVLRAVPSGLIERASFADGCLALGINENTFNLNTSYSPILEHIDVDVWALRGSRVDPAAVQAIQSANAARSRSKRVVDSGWTEGGDIRIVVRLPKLTEQMVVGIPVGIQEYIVEDSYPAFDYAGKPSGTIGITENKICHGFGSFLRRSGADEGDELIIDFDLANKMAKLEVRVGKTRVPNQL